MKILGIASSIRKASPNNGLLLSAKAYAGNTMEIANISELPHFNMDYFSSKHGKYDPIRAFQKQLAECDGLLFAASEFPYGYTHGVSSPLKNAIDWGSMVPNKKDVLERSKQDQVYTTFFQTPHPSKQDHTRIGMQNLFEGKICGIIGAGRNIDTDLHTTFNLRQLCNQLGLNCVLDVPNITSIANIYQPIPYSYPMLFNINNGGVIDKNLHHLVAEAVNVIVSRFNLEATTIKSDKFTSKKSVGDKVTVGNIEGFPLRDHQGFPSSVIRDINPNYFVKSQTHLNKENHLTVPYQKDTLQSTTLHKDTLQSTSPVEDTLQSTALHKDTLQSTSPVEDGNFNSGKSYQSNTLHAAASLKGDNKRINRQQCYHSLAPRFTIPHVDIESQASREGPLPNEQHTPIDASSDKATDSSAPYSNYAPYMPYPNDPFYPDEGHRPDFEISPQDRTQNKGTAISYKEALEQQRKLKEQNSDNKFATMKNMRNYGDYTPSSPITNTVNSNNRKYFQEGLLTPPSVVDQNITTPTRTSEIKQRAAVRQENMDELGSAREMGMPYADSIYAHELHLLSTTNQDNPMRTLNRSIETESDSDDRKTADSDDEKYMNSYSKKPLTR